MDSYVVRIYRRGGKKSRILIGTAEAAGAERKMAFSNIEELWEILRRRKGHGPYARTYPRRRLQEEVMSATAASDIEGSVGGVRKI